MKCYKKKKNYLSRHHIKNTTTLHHAWCFILCLYQHNVKKLTEISFDLKMYPFKTFYFVSCKTSSVYVVLLLALQKIYYLRKTNDTNNI